MKLKDSNPNIDQFNEILTHNRIHFHETRTPKILENYWHTLKQLNLLIDQQKDEQDSIQTETFKNKEKNLNDNEIMKNVELTNKKEEELNEDYYKLLNEIKHAEGELYLWQALVDQLMNKQNPFENIECLALIESNNLRYLMTKREVTFGRSSLVDIDLSKLNNSNKISREHGFIRMYENGTFYLFNNSNRPIFIDGKIILKSCKTQLFDKSIIQVNTSNTSLKDLLKIQKI